LQEQIDREAIAVTVKANKLTGRALLAVCRTVGRQIVKHRKAKQTPRGRQSAKKLMNHNVPTSTVPLEGDAKLFDRIARKWNVDYHFHKTGKDKYLLLFKAGQTDAITGTFAEYTKEYMKRAKDKRQPIAEQARQAAELVKRQKPKEHTRKREVTRE
jgi:hypothetical protein